MRPPALARLPPSRSISRCGGSAAPVIGLVLPEGVLPIGLSFWVAVRVDMRAEAQLGIRPPIAAHRLEPGRSQAHSAILPGGSLISSREDRR